MLVVKKEPKNKKQNIDYKKNCFALKEMSPFWKPHTEQTKAKVSVDVIFITQISNVAMIKENVFTSRALGIDIVRVWKQEP